MPADFSLHLFADGQVECSDDVSSLRVRIVPRDVLEPFLPTSPVSAVYLLLDDARQVYYVGETANANKRHRNHLNKYPWWNHAVYFYVSAFDVERLRKFLQNKLFESVRSMQAGVVLVTSIAGFSGPIPSNGDTFWRQMCLCGRALRILPFIGNPVLPGVLATQLDNSPQKLAVPPPPPWTISSLSSALVARHGGSVNGVRQLLAAYHGRKAGKKWRPILREAGVLFDHGTGLVTDWTKAKNPLP